MKRIFVFFLAILFFSNFVSCIIFDLNEEFDKEGILTGKIQGVFPSGISTSNILFYKGSMRIPLDFVLKKIQDEYYLYANLEGKSPGNYSIKIEKTAYLQEGTLSNEDIIKNFYITNKTAEFIVSPGVIESDKDFFIELKNKAEKSLKVDIQLEKDDDKTREVLVFIDNKNKESGTINLNVGEKKSVKFVLGENGNSGVYKIRFSSGTTSYEIPVYVLSNPNSYESSRISLQPEEAVYNDIKVKERVTKVLKLVNLESEDIKGISFSISESLRDYVKILNSSVDLTGGKIEDIYLEIFSDREGEVSGLITANSGQEISISSVKIKFINEKTPNPKNTSQDISRSSLSCEEVEGKFCKDDEECQGDIFNSIDSNENGYCCVGECVKKGNNPNVKSGSNIGWILLILVVIAGLIIFFKFKSARKPTQLLKGKY